MILYGQQHKSDYPRCTDNVFELEATRELYEAVRDELLIAGYDADRLELYQDGWFVEGCYKGESLEEIYKELRITRENQPCHAND